MNSSFSLLLLSPVDQEVNADKRRHKVEGLVPEAAPCVEDCSMCGAGERPLSVGGHGVGGNTLLWRGACFVEWESVVVRSMDLGLGVWCIRKGTLLKGLRIRT